MDMKGQIRGRIFDIWLFFFFFASLMAISFLDLIPKQGVGQRLSRILYLFIHFLLY